MPCRIKKGNLENKYGYICIVIVIYTIYSSFGYNGTHIFKILHSTTGSTDCDCPLKNGLILKNSKMFIIIFLKVPSERLGPGASFLCRTQFSTVIGKIKNAENIL